MSDLTDRLVEMLERRQLFHAPALAQEARVVMQVLGRGGGWEYGPDVEDASCDVFAISIGRSIAKQAQLEHVHGLPIHGKGYKIVAGLLPRDAEQCVVFDGSEISARDWMFEFRKVGKKIQIQVSPADLEHGAVTNMLVAEIGEVNLARHVIRIIIAGGCTRPFSGLAAAFAGDFPGCMYGHLLAKKRGGLVSE